MTEPPAPTVVEIDPANDRARHVRRELLALLNRWRRLYGEGIAGYAIAVWDGRGEVATAHYTDEGPVGRCLMPAFVHDALNRHVAVEIAEENGDGKDSA